jgi:hypothetical protein
MSLRTSILPGLAAIDAALGNTQGLDLRPTTLTILQRSWSGGRRGVGNAAIVSTLALPPIYIRHVTEREIAGSGGRYLQGDWMCGPIRPAWTSLTGTQGGFVIAQLDPPVTTPGVENIYVFSATNPNAAGEVGENQLVQLHQDLALAFMLVLRRRATTP